MLHQPNVPALNAAAPSTDAATASGPFTRIRFPPAHMEPKPSFCALGVGRTVHTRDCTVLYSTIPDSLLQAHWSSFTPRKKVSGFRPDSLPRPMSPCRRSSDVTVVRPTGWSPPDERSQALRCTALYVLYQSQMRETHSFHRWALPLPPPKTVLPPCVLHLIQR
jgi:hypothetical protein